MSQLDLFETRGPVFYRRPAIDRSGAAAAYVHLIRGADDPERAPRTRGPDRDAAPHLTLKRTTTIDQWRARILAHMADRVPRTFNRIGVELCGLTADVLFSTPADPALWALVEAGDLELTMEAPILFRRAQ